MTFTLIYIISKNYQKNNIKESDLFVKKYNNIVNVEMDKCINKHMIDFFIKTRSYVNDEITGMINDKLNIYYDKNIHINEKYEYDIYNIDIINVLFKKTISEISELKELNENLFKLLTTNKNVIIIIEKDLIYFLNIILKRNKINTKIMYNSDFKKSINNMINEYKAMCF